MEDLQKQRIQKMLERFEWHDWEQTLTEEQKALSYHKKAKLFQKQKEDPQQELLTQSDAIQL